MWFCLCQRRVVGAYLLIFGSYAFTSQVILVNYTVSTFCVAVLGHGGSCHTAQDTTLASVRCDSFIGFEGSVALAALEVFRIQHLDISHHPNVRACNQSIVDNLSQILSRL